MRTPPLDSVLEELRGERQVYPALALPGTPAVAAVGPLAQSSGAQVEFLATIRVLGMHDGDACGLRLRSSVTGVNLPTASSEYTDVYVEFLNCSIPAGGDESDSVCSGVSLSVDTSHSNSNMSIAVNRSVCTSGSVDVAALSLDTAGSVQLRALLDHSVLESFLGSGGERVVTRRVYPSEPDVAINAQLISRCGDGVGACSCSFTDVSTYILRSSTEMRSDSSDEDEDKGRRVVFIVVVTVIVLPMIGYFVYRLMKRHRDVNDKDTALLNSM